MPDVQISETLAYMADRFEIDLASLAEDAITDRILRDPMSALTARMERALLAAREEGRRFGHKHIGCEHVFLAILLDPHAIPSQILRDMGAADDVVQRLRALLGSECYNRPPVGDRHGKDDSSEKA
jgi:hypothetical protein